MRTFIDRLRALERAPHWLKRSAHRQAWIDAGFYTNETLPQIIRRRTAEDPHVRLVFGSRERPSETTIGAAFQDSAEIALGFGRLGLKEGDVIAIQVPNWREGLLATLAAWRIGAIVVPVIHTYDRAELSFVLEMTNARALIIPDRWKKIDYAARLESLIRTVDIEHVIVIGAGPMPRPVTRWDALVGTIGPHRPVRARPDDACLINFTSGTTSAPKGVVHTHHTIGAEIPLFPSIPSPARRPKFMPLPGGHIAGLIGSLAPFLTGQSIILMDQFDEELCLELLKRYRPDRGGGVPFQVSFYCDHAAEAFPDGCVQMGVGAANVSPELMARCEALGWAGTRSYGSTEHPTISGTSPDDPFDKRMTTDGRLLPGVRVRLVDERDHQVACPAAGEILSMGPELCMGYLDAELNAAAFADDGWFRTGDIGAMDADGYLRIVDRKKDIIIRGGENISSKEVEDVMLRHPAVAESAVVAWPDSRLGERVAVFVRWNRGLSLDLEQVRAHFRAAGVAVYKTPERIVVLEEFPRTPAGKILKTELRQRLRALGAENIKPAEI
jgi:acyl-CoA synthetase (AMP-forming)/AMP-acid ligase II